MKHVPFSFVTCTIDRDKYDQFQAQARDLFGPHTQFIRIDNPPSLAEGYTHGLKKVEGEIAIFCHDDIQFLDPDTPQFITEDLQRVDVVGVAGTSRLITGNWVAAGFPHLHGQIIHKHPDRTDCSHILYGCGGDEPLVGDIQAVDGVFMAAKPELFREIGFDVSRFNGFHLYDLDFSYTAYRAGYKLAVDHRIRLIHASGGGYDDTWRRYAFRFHRKHKQHLAQKVDPILFYRQRSLPTLAEGINVSCNTLTMTRLIQKGQQWLLSSPGVAPQPVAPGTLDDRSIDYLVLGEASCLGDLIAKCQPHSLIRLEGAVTAEQLWRHAQCNGVKVLAATEKTQQPGMLFMVKT